MSIRLPFADAIENRRLRMNVRGLDLADAKKAARAAAAEAEGRNDYRPRLWFPNEEVRQLARERDLAEQVSVKRATGVRGYTRHASEEESRAAIRESNRRASQKRRDEKAAARALTTSCAPS